MKSTLLFFLLLVSFTKSQASLWTAQNTWNEDWEKKYSTWIQNSVNPKYLEDLQISTDCADAVISLRWIFARENSLPMASTVSGGSLMTNQFGRWDRLPTSAELKNDQRFLSALKDINNATDSKTLFKDLYPVKLTAKMLTPGTLFVNATQASGHAEWIAKTSFDGLNSPIVFYSSTVPQQVREFLVYPFMKVKWPQKNANGFQKFRWPVVSGGTMHLQSPESMPGYSQEQYELGAQADQDFDDFIATRLTGQPLDGIRKVQVFASHLAERIENRIPVVLEGFKACGGGKCPNKDSAAFYNHSTYSRDGEILLLIQGINDLIYSNGHPLSVDDEMAGRMTVQWSQLQSDITFVIEGKTVRLGDVVAAFNQAKHSSDPNVTVAQRWGVF